MEKTPEYEAHQKRDPRNPPSKEEKKAEAKNDTIHERREMPSNE